MDSKLCALTDLGRVVVLLLVAQVSAMFKGSIRNDLLERTACVKPCETANKNSRMLTGCNGRTVLPTREPLTMFGFIPLGGGSFHRASANLWEPWPKRTRWVGVRVREFS